MTCGSRSWCTLKPGLLDPQGKAVEARCPRMGWTNVRDVRVGKHIKLTVEADDEAAAQAQVEEMAAAAAVEPGDRGVPGPASRAGGA